ncbi:bifunctional phosphopantothenoylcysteine decarboxylase/phosphopantothenate--cysteine ligase CoaBC [Alkaliphilus crotonatoxidans]
MLKGKRVVVGVTGGIAAYKACDLVSKLKKLQAEVDVIMTKAATEFVQPQTLQALSQNPVIVDMFQSPRYWDIEHISLAQKADVLVVAPATANVIGKVANGIADDMLTTTIMASTAKVVFAPAMNTKMYENKIVQQNMEKLRGLGYGFIQPGSGRLACGDVGVGKLSDIDEIVQFVVNLTQIPQDLKDLPILITAGPTIEAIDPVRFLTNHSSGKMGYSLAEAAKARGARVTLVSGPTHLQPPAGVEFVPVQTAVEMLGAVMDRYDDQQVVIKAAAVADYRPERVSEKKIKKQDDSLTINFVRNPDILLELGKAKKQQFLVGFAAETNQVVEYAIEKIKKKNLDLIVANDVSQEGAGFGSDTNIVLLIDPQERVRPLEKANKSEIANKILDKIKEML